MASAQALSDFAPFVYSHHSVGGGSGLTEHQALHPQVRHRTGDRVTGADKCQGQTSDRQISDRGRQVMGQTSDRDREVTGTEQ